MSEYNHGKVKEIDLTDEMKTSFLNYAMSVIVSRALPDVRDGLKPVHRRILFSMNELHIYSNQAHKKSARIVGEVMGKYHPHGDSSIYEAMVRMAQDFSYRYPLVDGHGNFGSIDGDGAAAMRYTEARMSKITMEMLRDLDKNTVNFVDNYDSTEREPEVLPSRIPQLLANGATGIAVGMATNIPPHNLGEVIDAVLALMDNNEIGCLDLMQYIKGPDFPTGGYILGYSGLRQAYETGNGSIVIRAKADIIENTHNKNSIIITQIPYQVNKTRLIERIAEIAKDKIIEGITDLRDESNRNGMRIVLDLRRDVNPNVMLNNLYKYTQLQTTFGLNMIALVNGEPKKLNLKEILVHYINHQYEIITKRTIYDLDQSLAKLHKLEGYIIALDNIDEVIIIIRKTTDGTEKEKLMTRFGLSDIQSQAILDMQLKRLSGLNREKTISEYEETKKDVIYYQSILANEDIKHEIIKSELLEIKEKYNNPRVSEISLDVDLTIENEDLIPVEDVVITITNNGYAKRMNIDNYKTQNRGGTGLAGIKTNTDDFVVHSLMTSTHDYLLFFTNKGRVYKKKGYEIPEGSRLAKGLPVVNILDLDKDEKLAAITNIKNFDENYLVFLTKKGLVKRTLVSEYQNIRSTGIIALTLREEDELLEVCLTDGSYDIVLGATNGKAIRFHETDVRAVGRTASGVKGMSLNAKDNVIGGCLIQTEDQKIMVVTEKGYGKTTQAAEYRLQTRGGKGIKTLNVTEKNGALIALKSVTVDKDLIITTDKGVVIRMCIAQIPTIGRATQGVKLIRLREDQVVGTVTLIPHSDDVCEIVDLETPSE